MIYVFFILFLGIIFLKLALIYKNQLQIQKKLKIFSQKWNLNINPHLSFFSPKIPVLQNHLWKIIWEKQGKGRSFHHIIKIYYDFPYSINDFHIVHKNLLPKLESSSNFQEIAKNIYSDLKDWKNNEIFFKKITAIQSEYGWGLLEVKNQKGFYTIIAEPSEPQAWKHIEDVLLLLSHEFAIR